MQVRQRRQTHWSQAEVSRRSDNDRPSSILSALNIHFAQHLSRTSRHGVKKNDRPSSKAASINVESGAISGKAVWCGNCVTRAPSEALYKRSKDSWCGKMWRDAGLERDRGGDAAWKYGDEENDRAEANVSRTTVSAHDKKNKRRVFSDAFCSVAG